MRYQVEDPKDPRNDLTSIDKEFGKMCIFVNSIMPKKQEKHDFDWFMYFDGTQSRIRFRVGILFVSPIGIIDLFSYRLDFDCTINIA